MKILEDKHNWTLNFYSDWTLIRERKATLLLH